MLLCYTLLSVQATSGPGSWGASSITTSLSNSSTHSSVYLAVLRAICGADVGSEAGGNFIDTANNYQDEQSEMIIGEWMEKRGIRDDIVLATYVLSLVVQPIQVEQ